MENRQKLLTLWALCSSLAGAAPLPAAVTERMELVMGTLLEVQAAAEADQAAQQAVASALQEARRWDGLLSNYKQDSEISRINREAYPESTVAAHGVFDFLSAAARLSEATSGYFSIAAEPLTLLWRLREGGLERMPEGSDIEGARIRSDYKALELYKSDRSVRFLIAGMGIDSGGIGKGYALDRSLQAMRLPALAEATLNFGGEVLYWCAGTCRKRVRLRHPLDPGRDWGTLSVKLASATPTAVSTSANYERGVVLREGGRERNLGHVFNPRTGRLVEDQIRSVTAIAPSAAAADAYSTALFAMGFEEARRFARSLPDVCMVALYEPAKNDIVEYRSPACARFLGD